jgi:hypothetical protein
MVRVDQVGGGSSPQVLQNDQANYGLRDGTVSINNYRMWQPDLSVTRLPTDSPGMLRFLSRMDGLTTEMQTISQRQANRSELLIVRDRNGEEDGAESKPVVVPHDNALEEGYFQSDWSAGVQPVDLRDTMHRRGWTYFRITGTLAGKSVSGRGRLPLVYAASERYTPWLNLRVGDSVQMIDTTNGATELDAEGNAVARFPQGSYFAGLARPWMGLHTVDTIRRDAAERSAPFTTQFLESGRDVQVRVDLDMVELTYTVDMEADLVTAIEITHAGKPAGRLEFEYLQDIDGVSSQFETPRAGTRGATLRRSTGISWLARLVETAAVD